MLLRPLNRFGDRNGRALLLIITNALRQSAQKLPLSLAQLRVPQQPQFVSAQILLLSSPLFSRET